MSVRTLNGQHGSISVTAIAILAAVMLLLMIFLERESVNYILRLVEQTADLSAEAAAQSHDVYYDVTATGYVLEERVATVCVDSTPTGCRRWYSYTYVVTVPRTVSSPNPVEARELLKGWKRLFGCWEGTGSPSPPDYVCTDVQVTFRRLEFTETARSLAAGTFAANWHDRSSAILLDLREPLLDGLNRKVTVTADIEIRSIFGLFPSKRKTIQGSAVAIVPRLTLQR